MGLTMEITAVRRFSLSTSFTTYSGTKKKKRERWRKRLPCKHRTLSSEPPANTISLQISIQKRRKRRGGRRKKEKGG